MFKGKKVLVVVPARGGSKGVKLKNIQPVGGVPLVALAGRLAGALPYVDRAIVSTDHPEIARVAKEAGLDVPFMRPESISGDVIPDLEVLSHALGTMETMDRMQYDIVLMLQPTCPFRRPGHVTAVVEKLVEGGYDAVWTLSETDTKQHPLKQLVVQNGALDYYDPKGAGVIARQQLTPVYHRNGAAYAITRECLLEKKSIKGDRTGAVVITDILVNIDTPADFVLADLYLARGYGR